MSVKAVNFRSWPKGLKLLTLAQIGSRFGDSFTEIALILLIMHTAKHPFIAMGVVLSMVSLPQLITGWLTVAVINRYNPRYLLLGSDIIRGILVVLLPFLPMPIVVSGAVFIIYSLNTLSHPLQQHYQRVLAQTDELTMQSSGWRNKWAHLMALAAYVLVVPLIHLVGYWAAFLIDALSFFFSAFVIWKLSVVSLRQTTPKDLSPLTILKSTLRKIFHQESLTKLLWMSVSTFMLISAANTILDPSVRNLWHHNSSMYAWIVIAITIGQSTGSWAMEHYGMRIKTTMGIAIGSTLTGIGFIVAAHIQYMDGILLLLALTGAGNALFAISAGVAFQNRTADNDRPQILATRSFLSGATGALGSIAAGYGLRWIGPAMVMTLVGVFALIIAGTSLTIYNLRLKETMGS